MIPNHSVYFGMFDYIFCKSIICINFSRQAMKFDVICLYITSIYHRFFKKKKIFEKAISFYISQRLRDAFDNSK